jgi:hypothetical protein
VFRRELDTLTLELSMTDDGRAFELRTTPLFPSLSDGERFSDVEQAFQRQAEVEAALIADEWTLEWHESVRR